MRDTKYYLLNPDTGDLTFKGPLTRMKGDHSHMPSRTKAYLLGDERGHINASSTGGINERINIVPQHKDLNHGAYYAMEKGERKALENGAQIDSEKIAFVNGKPGDRPSAFMVNDSVTYPNGQTENLNYSFTNASYAEQDQWNKMSASMPDIYDSPNPGDTGRASMSTGEYSKLMDETDKALPNIEDEYTQGAYTPPPSPVSEEADSNLNHAIPTDMSMDADNSASTGTDTSTDSNSSPDHHVDADSDLGAESNVEDAEASPDDK